MDVKLISKIYELKGIVKAAVNMAEHNGEYENPFLDSIDSKVKDIIEQIEHSGSEL